MKIYLSPNTAGRGSWLNGNLQHLKRFIQNELANSAFKSSFEDFRLNLSYPPMYVLPGVVGIEVAFMQHYDTLPYSRLNRRFKTIDISLKSPEFSEYCDKEEQKNYQHKFEIETQFKNISETKLGQILIDKFLEATEIISSKLKKEDVFDIDIFKQVLVSIKQKINPEFLQELNTAQEREVKDETLNRAIQQRSERQKNDKPKNKLIRDLRVYYNELPNKALYPYDYIYSEIFLNLLATEGLMCPAYDHLYIEVATTFEEALKRSFSFDFFARGPAVIDFDKYQTLSDYEKGKEVFNTILEGLMDIATIDNLDRNIIKKVAKKIEEKGIDTELHFKTIENDSYKLVITFFSRSMEDECPIFFNLTDKKNNMTKRKQIGKADNSQLFLWLQKITLTNKKIKIKSSNSIRGQVWLKDKPTEMEFEIAELMK